MGSCISDSVESSVSSVDSPSIINQEVGTETSTLNVAEENNEVKNARKWLSLVRCYAKDNILSSHFLLSISSFAISFKLNSENLNLNEKLSNFGHAMKGPQRERTRVSTMRCGVLHKVTGILKPQLKRTKKGFIILVSASFKMIMEFLIETFANGEDIDQAIGMENLR
ncbi:hypothetical protein Tco_0690189 [Tanacetum coccineum]